MDDGCGSVPRGRHYFLMRAANVPCTTCACVSESDLLGFSDSDAQILPMGLERAKWRGIFGRNLGYDSTYEYAYGERSVNEEERA